MRCLNCSRNGILLSAELCPYCGVHLSSLSALKLRKEKHPNSVGAGWQKKARETLKPTTAPSLPTFELEVVTVRDVQRSGGFLGFGGTVKLNLNRRRQQAQYYTELLANGVSLDLVYIPGGKFLMGSPAREGDDNERPQHQVTVQPFFMGKYPVTQAQWRAIASLPKIERELKTDPSFSKGNGRPVEEVSWYDAVEFCQRLSRATGREYRLPSEAEWEYACRAGTTTPFYFGKTISTDLANYQGDYTYACEPKEVYRGKTTPVGQFPPNAFGLYDLHGNVWEWCADTWHKNYEGAPTDGTAWTVGGDENISPVRGGSWNDFPENCRTAARINFVERDLILNCIGFRVVCGGERTH